MLFPRIREKFARFVQNFEGNNDDAVIVYEQTAPLSRTKAGV